MFLTGCRLGWQRVNGSQSAGGVCLILSANKSGEYFGYARTASSISENSITILSTMHKTDAVDSSGTPKFILTPATEFASKGRITEDSARGTLFWEAELSNSDNEATRPAIASAAAWGNTFRVEWISRNRFPFYWTQGLRNPWNANRQGKIARNGTELETNVGKRLVHMFHRLGPSTAGPAGMPPTQIPLRTSGAQMPAR